MPIKIPVYEQQIVPRTFGTTPHARPLPHFDTGAEFKAIGQALNNISDLQLRVDQAERSMRLTTANAQAASAIEFAPPIEWPTTVIRAHPMASMTPSRSDTKSSVA